MPHPVTTLAAAAAYLINNSPGPLHLPLQRLTQMLYLADWKSAIEYRCQLTYLDWRRGFTGPESWRLERFIERSPDFDAASRADALGRERLELRRWPAASREADLDATERWLLDFVLATPRTRPEPPLATLIASTYPMMSTSSPQELDLAALAERYERLR